MNEPELEESDYVRRRCRFARPTFPAFRRRGISVLIGAAPTTAEGWLTQRLSRTTISSRSRMGPCTACGECRGVLQKNLPGEADPLSGLIVPRAIVGPDSAAARMNGVISIAGRRGKPRIA